MHLVTKTTLLAICKEVVSIDNKVGIKHALLRIIIPMCQWSLLSGGVGEVVTKRFSGCTSELICCQTWLSHTDMFSKQGFHPNIIQCMCTKS